MFGVHYYLVAAHVTDAVCGAATGTAPVAPVVDAAGTAPVAPVVAAAGAEPVAR